MEVVPLSGVIRGPYAGVERDADAARAPGRGQMAGGRALMQVGDQLAEVGQRIQRAKTNVDIAAARREMDVAKDNFNSFSAANADENKWGEQSQKEITEAKKRIGAMKLSREAQAALAPELADFEQRFGAEVKHATIKQSVARLRARTYNLAEDLAREGDTERAVTIVRDLARDGAVNDDEARIKIRQLGELATKSTIVREINTSPMNAKALLEEREKDGRWTHFSALDEADRYQLTRSAQAAIGTLYEETGNALAEDIVKGNTDGIEKRITMAMDDGKIRASQAKSLIKAARGQFEPAEVATRGAILLDAVAMMDPSNPKDFDTQAIYLRAEASALPESVREYVNSSIERRRSSGMSKSELKPQIDAADFLKDQLDHDVFGRYSDTDKTPYEAEMEKTGGFFGIGGKLKPKQTNAGVVIAKRDESGQPIIDKAKRAKNQADREAAMSRYWEASQALTTFRKQNPNADENAAISFVRKYTEKAREKAASRGLTINPATAP